MIGASTKMIPTWNTLRTSSRAVSIWEAKRSCSLLLGDHAVAVGVRGLLGGELVLELLPGGDADRPLVLAPTARRGR